MILNTTKYNTTQQNTKQNNTIQCNITHHKTKQNKTKQSIIHSRTQQSTIRHHVYTIKHSTIRKMKHTITNYHKIKHNTVK